LKSRADVVSAFGANLNVFDIFSFAIAFNFCLVDFALFLKVGFIPYDGQMHIGTGILFDLH
jgi:hypothetical protein